MTSQSFSLCVRTCRPIALCLGLALVSSGCALTQTTTTIRAQPGPVTQRLKLSREGAAPLKATFHQEGNAIVGRVAFADNCVSEATRRVAREEVMTTATNKKGVTALMVVGGVLTLAGTALFASGSDKDETVYCGNGSAGGPEDGDRCSSEAGVYREVGGIVAGTGIAGLIGGGILLGQKPRVETKPLEAQEMRSLGWTVGSCGKQASLDGLSLGVTVPGAGSWSGRVEVDGTTRIELPARFEPATVAVVVGAVPASAAGLITPGMQIGEVSLALTAPKSKTALRAR